jgi:hypothetical protein
VSDLIESRISEIRQTIAAASPGPWYFTLVEADEGNVCISHEHWDLWRLELEPEVLRSEPGVLEAKLEARCVNVGCVIAEAPDMHLIANSRAFLEALLAERDGMKAEIARLSEHAKEWRDVANQRALEMIDLSADAERMDWLEAEHSRVDPVMRLTVKEHHFRESPLWANVNGAREAIDTARAQMVLPRQVRPHTPGPGYICADCNAPHVAGCKDRQLDGGQCPSVAASLDPSSAPSETPDYRRQVTMSESTVRDYHRLREALGVGPDVSFDHCITLVRQYVYYGENPPARSSSITGSATEAADRIRKVIARRAARSRVQNYEPTMVTVGIADLEAVLALAAGERVGAAAGSPDREAGSGTAQATCGYPKCESEPCQTAACPLCGLYMHCTQCPGCASSHPVPSEGGGE